MDDSDDKLLKRLQQGDESAFVALLEQYHAAMRRAARLWVSTDASADEVVQDTWLGVLDALSSFEGQTSVETWIFQILVDRARAMRAREARLASVSASTENARHAGSEQETPTQLLLRKELAGELEAAMLDLSERQRTVVVLRDALGWSPGAVCSALRVNEINQRVLLHRARARLRASLEHHRALG